MTGKTHLLLGAITGVLIALLKDMEPTPGLLVTGAAAVGALLPDIDSPNSTISHKARPARLLLFWIPHRTLTHSLLILGLLWWLTFSTGLLLVYGLTLGYMSHIIADMATTRGVPVFYPVWNRQLHIFPPLLRITTGSWEESAVAFLVTGVLFYCLLMMFGVIP